MAYDVKQAVKYNSGLMRRSRSRRKTYERERVGSRDRLAQELQEIDRSTIDILSEGGAGADRQRFCADLPSIRKREKEALEKRQKKAKQDKKIQEAVTQKEEEERRKLGALGSAGSNGGGVSDDVSGQNMTKNMGRMAKKKEARIKAQEQQDARAKRRHSLLLRKEELAAKLEKRRLLTEEKGGDMEAVLRAEAESNMPVEPPLEPDNIYRQLKLFYV